MRFMILNNALARIKLPIAMEVIWLATILAVPLIIAPQDSMIFNYQLPKVVLLRGMVSLMAALWLLRWLTAQASPFSALQEDTRPGWHSFRKWVSAQPVRLLTLGVLAFLLINVISAIFSVSSGVSFWGGYRAPDGLGLHNVLMYVVLFWVVHRNVTSSDQIWRILGAIAASGGIAALIGVLQRVSAITAGAPVTNADGIASTIGNPDVLGAYLVLTIPVTIGLATTRFVKSFSLGEQAAWVLLIAVQMLAVAFTLSLGAIAGLIVALIALLGFGYFVMEQAATIKAISVTVIAVALTFLSMSFVSDLPAPIASEAVVQTFNDRDFLDVSPVPVDGSLSHRQDIWAASADLIFSRPSLPSQGSLVPGLRFLFGYGPDTYSYVFPLKATDAVGLQNDAQNELIHRTVELGLLGGVSTLALYVLAIAVLVWLLARHWSGISQDQKMVIVLISAALLGRFTQQMLHMGGVGDAMLFWIILALIPATFRAWPVSSEGRPFDFRGFPISSERSAYLLGARIAMALLLIAGMGWIFTDRGINSVRADNVAASARLIEPTEINRAEGLALFDAAIELAPDVPNYYRLRGDFLVAVNDTVPKGLESNTVLEEIYADRALALQMDPLSGESLLDMANSAFDLTRSGYEGLDAVGEEQYRELMALSPNFKESHALLWILLAIAYMEVDRAERSLDFLDSALAIDASNFTHSKALFVQGVAYSELGQLDNAIVSLNRVLEIGANDQITMQTYRQLADVYSASGEPQLASDHYEQYYRMSNPDEYNQG